MAFQIAFPFACAHMPVKLKFAKIQIADPPPSAPIGVDAELCAAIVRQNAEQCAQAAQAPAHSYRFANRKYHRDDDHTRPFYPSYARSQKERYRRTIAFEAIRHRPEAALQSERAIPHERATPQ
jgi:hypothetical protein